MVEKLQVSSAADELHTDIWHIKVETCKNRVFSTAGAQLGAEKRVQTNPLSLLTGTDLHTVFNKCLIDGWLEDAMFKMEEIVSDTHVETQVLPNSSTTLGKTKIVEL